MARQCAKCENRIPTWVVIDGKKRNLKSRKYCFVCSPFGKHNTRQLHKPENQDRIKSCVDCGRLFVTAKQRRCGSCNFQRRKKARLNKVYNIVGTACWLCGYDKGLDGVPVLEFHHVDPSLKRFNLSTRELAASKWSKVWEEMQKCMLTCCRCHREIHAGLFDKDVAIGVYLERWSHLHTAV